MGKTPKQFTKLAGLPILVHTLKVFQENKNIQNIIVVTNEEFVDLVWEFARTYSLSKILRVVAGGETRQESSRIGIDCCDKNTGFVLIHDGVRPFISNKTINQLANSVKIHKAVDTVIPSADTIVQIDKNNYIDNIPDRTLLRRGQTPQAFEYQLIKKAHEDALKRNIQNSTDDCALVMQMNHPVFTVIGNKQNMKITYPIDLHIADKLFQLRCQPSEENIYATLLEQFSDKTIIIAGGTSGIGKAINTLLKPYVKRLYALSRKTSPKFDITNYDTIKNTLKTIWEKNKSIDYVINCAGDLIRKDVEFTSVEEWDHIYDVNVKGTFLLTKALLPYLKKQNYGSIMFVGSSSYTRGRAGYSAYCSSKAALVNFCQAFAQEVSTYNIRVNVASPGRVDTPLRYRNFGKEDPKMLLNTEYVAKKILSALLQETTGSVFEIA
ncbi:MAG: bifunctional cytidylyltransferase/SDR family oxidoreductase [Desulfobacula sp.]|nr:bifunctional cytidylyltransferase/SDR family oxidoreductase [Desulfobacula sp.]